MILSFKNAGTEEVFNGQDGKAARKLVPETVVANARMKLDMINQAAVLEDLRVPPGNRLKKLKGNRAGQHSIRINDQYRVCFVWTERGAEDVEITDYH